MPSAANFHSQSDMKPPMEEKVIDHLARVQQEKVKRLSQNPFAAAAMLGAPKRHKEPAQIDDSTYIYDSNCMKTKRSAAGQDKVKVHTYISSKSA